MTPESYISSKIPSATAKPYSLRFSAWSESSPVRSNRSPPKPKKKWDTGAAQTVNQIEQQARSDQAAEAKQSRLLAGGLLVGGGVALAALSSALAYIAKSLTGVPLWKILIGIGGSILAVMLPITIVAFLKLRKRDLSAILEGSGWGINARMRLTHKQGWFFTEKPKHPSDSKELI